MTFWVLLWELIFVFAVLVFGAMTIWVTIQGARDIKHLTEALGLRHQTRGESDPEE